jgi:hypothetical protein
MALHYEIETAENATFARLRVSGAGRGGGKRGVVRGFSDASKKRLLDRYNQMPKDYRQHALFITLTYPGEFDGNWEQWKRDLDVFCKRLLRLYPRAVILWKLEFQKRGAPHYHLIVWGVPFIPFSWVARAWFEVVGSGDPAHLAAGTQVKRLKGDKKAVYYLCKYMAKRDTIFDSVACGRVWGFRNGAALPVFISCKRVSVKVFYEVKRTLRKWLERKTGKKAICWGLAGQGLTAYLDENTINRLVSLAREKHQTAF